MQKTAWEISTRRSSNSTGRNDQEGEDDTNSGRHRQNFLNELDELDEKIAENRANIFQAQLARFEAQTAAALKPSQKAGQLAQFEQRWAAAFGDDEAFARRARHSLRHWGSSGRRSRSSSPRRAGRLQAIRVGRRSSTSLRRTGTTPSGRSPIRRITICKPGWTRSTSSLRSSRPPMRSRVAGTRHSGAATCSPVCSRRTSPT